VMGRLDGKIAIVTGAGQGVGRGIALALAKEGAAISVAELDPRTSADAVAEIEALGAQVIDAPCDVADAGAVRSVVAATVAALGGVDILVNNAHLTQGIDRPFIELSRDDMRRQFEVGVLGAFEFMQACFPHMRSRRGKVINLASGAGFFGMEGFASYAAAKEAIRGMSRVAAREWGPLGINVNVICPSVLSPAVQDWASRQPATAPSGRGPVIPRVGLAEEDVGRTAVFLASPDADYITGHTFMVDGGMSMDAGR
jgi:NAD(P)-dependent dehydrogenase (short-subunit alcohol dehydrogenase family)